MAAKVLERLRRIEALGDGSEHGSEHGTVLLDELRALVGEAEAWARLEGDARAHDAIGRLRAAEAAVESTTQEEEEEVNASVTA